VVRGGHPPPRFSVHVLAVKPSVATVNRTGKAGENGQSSAGVAKLQLDQTVGCNTREGGYCSGLTSSTVITIDLVTGRSSVKQSQFKLAECGSL
jgi:hypothetical protein